jgi:excisionase family DNA binding protein
MKAHSRSPLMTVHELARYLRVHRTTVYRLLKQGHLPAFKIGSDWRFDKNLVDEWTMKQKNYTGDGGG